MSQVQIDNILLGLDNGDLAMENALHDIFNFFADNIRNFGQSLLNLTPLEKAIADKNRFMQVVGSTDYMTMEATPVQVPEGFKGTYLEYLTTIVGLLELAHRVGKEVLNPLETTLSQVIATEQARSRYDDVLHRKLKAFAEETATLESNLTGMFDSSLRYKASYGEVVRRNADWNDIFKLMERATRLNNLPLKSIAKKAIDLSVLFKTVADMAHAKELVLYDSRQRKLFADLSDLAGKQVSMIAVSYYHSQAAYNSISAAVKTIIKVHG